MLLLVNCHAFAQSNEIDNLVVSKIEMSPEVVEIDGEEKIQRAEIYTAELESEKDITLFLNWLENQYNQDIKENEKLVITPVQLEFESNREPNASSKLQSIMAFFQRRMIDVKRFFLPADQEAAIRNIVNKWKVSDHMERLTLTYVRSTLNGIACTWSFLASKQVPLVVALPIGIITGGMSGTFQWYNAKLGNFLIDSILLKKLFNITHADLEEMSKNVKVPKKYLSDKTPEEVTKLKKKVALYNFISKSEEFTKWYGMELGFTSIIKLGVRFGNYLTGTVMPSLTMQQEISQIGHTAFKGFLAQAGWDLSIAKSNQKQKDLVDHDTSLDANQKAEKKYKIQRRTNLKNFVVSVTEVSLLCATLSGHEFGTVGLGIMAVGGWSNYIRVNFGEKIGNSAKKCIHYLKQKFSYIEHFAYQKSLLV